LETAVRELAPTSRAHLQKIVDSYDNKKTLQAAIGLIGKRLKRLAKRGVYLELPS